MICPYCKSKIPDEYDGPPDFQTDATWRCSVCGEDLSSGKNPIDPNLYLAGSILFGGLAVGTLLLIIFVKPNTSLGGLKMALYVGPAAAIATVWFKKYKLGSKSKI